MLEEQDKQKVLHGQQDNPRPNQLIGQSDLEAMLDDNDDIINEPTNKIINDEQMNQYQDYQDIDYKGVYKYGKKR